LMASPHLSENFPWFQEMFSNGLHTSVWLIIPLGAGIAGILGILLGAPTLKLRGDYLAIVTLGFAEIIRVFLNNLDHPVNLTNGPKGLGQIDSITLFKFDAFDIPGINLAGQTDFLGITFNSVTKYYYLFLVLCVFSVIICHRLEL